MRDFTKIHIEEKLDGMEYVPFGHLADVVDKALLQISDMIMTEDKKLISRMTAVDVENYMNVEMYFVLLDYIEWLNQEQAELHTVKNCPICSNRRRADYLIRALVRRWQLTGKRQTYEKLVRFRADGEEEGRTIN